MVHLTPVAGGGQSAADVVTAEIGQLLGLPDVPMWASFSDLGGTSLSAGQLCVRLGKRLGITVPVSRVVGDVPLASVTAWLEAAARRRTTTSPTIAAAGPVPLTDTQASFWWNHHLDPEDTSVLCYMAWWIEGPVNEPALRSAFSDIVERHEALRARYTMLNEAVAIVNPEPGGRVFYTLPCTPDETTARSAMTAFLNRPLDLENAEVCRAGLIHIIGTGKSLLGLAVHHVAFDGWCEQLLAGDLSTAYAARQAGSKPIFQQPSPSMADIARECAARNAHADVDAQRSYWRKALASTSDLRVRGSAENCNGKCSPGAHVREFSLTHSILEVWHGLATATRTTEFTVLLAAYAHAVLHVTGQNVLTIGVPVLRRDSDLLTTAVTSLVNMVSVRVRAPEKGDWSSRVMDVRNEVNGAMAAQDVSFAEVVRLLNPPRTGRNPIFQTIFAYQNNQAPELKLTECNTHFVRPPSARPMAELLTEVWPDGRAAMVRAEHQCDRMPDEFAAEVIRVYAALLLAGPES